MKLVIKNPFLTDLFNQEKVALINNLSKKLNRHLLDEEVEFFINYNFTPTKGSSHQALINGTEPKLNNFFEPYRYNFSSLQARFGRRKSNSLERLNQDQENFCLGILEVEFHKMLQERAKTLEAYNKLQGLANG